MPELVVIGNLSAVDVFVDNGLEPYLKKIEEEARAQSIDLDISTENGRKAIASLAYKIAQSKTALDELGKELTEGWKTKSKAVDAERKRMREKLDALKEEIRRPLNEYENREKSRIARHEASLLEIETGGKYTLEQWQTLPLEAMSDRLKEIEREKESDWEEFSARGKHAIDTAVLNIQAAMAKRSAYDLEQAELMRLRHEKADQERRQREAAIAAEAAATAKSEAEAKAKAEIAYAEARVRRAEEEKRVAGERAEIDRIAAEKKAKMDAEAAARAEREKIESLLRQESEALAMREADKKHRSAINKLALSALSDAGIDGEVARKVIELIARGQVPHVKIQY